jgi:hypothetical protein
VIVNLSEDAGSVVLNALVPMMGSGWLELLSSDGKVLVVMPLSNPAAEEAIDGEIEFNKIGEGKVVLAGQAKVGRIVAADGGEVLSVDVGDEKSNAVIKLTTTKFWAGGVVWIDSFRLRMP